MKLTSQLLSARSILLAKLLNKRTPLSVYLSLTDRCPTICKYCNVPQKKQKEMSYIQIKSIIDDMKRMGSQRLQLVGGEPMIRNDIGKIIDSAKNKGLFVTTSTSGYSIPDKINEIRNIDIVFLSLDGDLETHEYQRGTGSFKNYLKAVEALKDNGIQFWTTTVLTSKNKHSLGYIFEMAEKYSFLTNFHLLYYSPDNPEEHFHPTNQPKDLIMSDSENREIIRLLIMKKKNGAPIASSESYFEYLLGWDDYNKMYSNKIYNNVRCWAGKLYCHVDTGGMVYPCGDSIGRIKGYNVLEMGFKNAFNCLNEIPCNSCIVACNVEQNLMFSLNVKTIFNWLSNIK